MTTPPWRASTPREYLASLEPFGIKLGLDTIREICGVLDDPHQAYQSLLIAGTNGKGSVAAFTDEALRAAGHRVGRYTSPHLIHLEERFHVGGVPVTAEALDAAIDNVRSVVRRLQEEHRLDGHPTYFEVTTAAAFLLFREAHVEVAVLEVGLGGRFDATNVVMPVVSSITSIAHDHERHLGSTLSDIAREKAGIIKTGAPVVIGALPAEARDVVAARCRERGAPLIETGDSRVQAGVKDGATVMRLVTPVRDYGPVRLALRGDHQIQNAVVAVRLLETLDTAGLRVPAAAVRSGLDSARWPGRLDLRTLRDGRRVLVDGAHNPSGASALAKYIGREWPRGLPLVFGAMRDKDLPGMLTDLAALARPLVLTQAPGSRAASVTELAAAASAVGAAPVLEPDLDHALERAWSMDTTVVVAGSLYLAGAVLERIERQ